MHVGFDAPEEGEEEKVKSKYFDIISTRITADMMIRHGYTEDCEGCRRKKSGLKGARGHSEICRRRTMEAVSQEEEGLDMIRRDQ